jgi:hypothetical protein
MDLATRATDIEVFHMEQANLKTTHFILGGFPYGWNASDYYVPSLRLSRF